MLELCIDLKSVKYFRGSCAMRLLGLIAVLCIPQLALAQDVEPKSEPEAAKNSKLAVLLFGHWYRVFLVLAMLAGASFAQAQDVPQVISPLRVQIDFNTVNLVRPC
jgi:hypothetical protein